MINVIASAKLIRLEKDGLASRSFIAFDVTSKGPCWRKLPQFMADHLLSDKDWNVLTTVVYRHCMTDHDGDDGGSTRPGNDQPFFSAKV